MYMYSDMYMCRWVGIESFLFIQNLDELGFQFLFSSPKNDIAYSIVIDFFFNSFFLDHGIIVQFEWYIYCIIGQNLPSDWFKKGKAIHNNIYIYFIRIHVHQYMTAQSNR